MRESVTLRLRPKPLYLGVKVDGADVSGENAPPVALDVIAVNGAGGRIAAPGVAYSLISENWSYDWYQQDGRWQWRRTSRDTVVSQGRSTSAPARRRASVRASWAGATIGWS